MLLQRPVGIQKLVLSNLNQLSENDVKYMQEMAGQRFDMIINNLRSMPRTMLLTIR
jgi:predicted PolB exonuclease-like 3'-5' exonuclease